VSEPFTVNINSLEYGGVTEKRVKLWREMLTSGIECAPVKVRPLADLPGRFKVYSGQDLVEAAKTLGRVSVMAVVD
jgi:hypothetical protein